MRLRLSFSELHPGRFSSIVSAKTCIISVYLGSDADTRTNQLGYNAIMDIKRIIWIVVIVIVLIIGAVGFALVSGFRAITAPVSELREDLGTQVARILNPTPTIIPDPITIVREVRSLARLETIHYSVEKIIVAETGQGPFGFLFGDRLLLVAHGTVIAGVDLDKIDLDSVWTDELGSVHIVLPEPEVFVATLDNDKSYIYDREKGFFTRGDANLETAARQAAEEEILRAALEDNILEQASINAENYLYSFLHALGFTDVIFSDVAGRPSSTPSATPTVQSPASP
jgi:hypothetical protein